jgi:3-O-methylgallate 3,4-dioxygenase
MAQLTSAFASSHGIMVTSELSDWLHHFSEFDRTVPLIDPAGKRRQFDELLASAPADAADRIAPAKISEKFKQMHDALERLRDDIAKAGLDALIIVGDDQDELFDSSNMPSFAVYCGDTIGNGQRSADHAESWIVRARDRRLEAGTDVKYPVHAALARHMIENLREQKFDPAVLHRLPEGQGESHAMSFVHRYLLQKTNIPIVPVFLNSFFPPNQPTPERCLELGKAIAAAVKSFPENIKVGIIASGGLSHFVVDEELDRKVVTAIQSGDIGAMGKIPLYKLQSGTSEIRNWICVAGAVSTIPLSWVEYIPGYRTPAMTGTGLCFARWGEAGSV